MRVAMTGSDGNLSPIGTTVETVTLESDEGGTGDEVKARKQESSTSTRREEQGREETIFAVGSSKVSI